MTKFSRRKVLKGSAALGATTAFSASSNAGLLGAVKSLVVKRTKIKACVVGSGFGGSVASLRLTQAGIPTALVERGKHWDWSKTGEDTYPTISTKGLIGTLADVPGGILWTDPGALPASTGLLEQYNDPGIPVGVGACLGGGSVVYGGVLLKPLRENFEAAMPMLNYDDFEQKYWPKVLEKVSGGPIPDDILNHPNYTSMRAFIEMAQGAGLDVRRSDVSFNWDVVREELEGKRIGAASIGEYFLGCNSGAKNTLDRNYLAEANDTGNLDIFTLHNVGHVERRKSDGKYEVHCQVLNEVGLVIAKHIIECEYLFMAAGSLHSTRLLLKAKVLGDIDGLQGVGENWGTNGDELKTMDGISLPTGEVQGGPPAIACFDTSNPYKNTGFMHAPSPLNDEGTLLQMGMVISDVMPTATFNALNSKLETNYSKEDNANCTKALVSTLHKMTGVGGGEVNDSIEATWHPVGGVVMGISSNMQGELYGAPGLFCIDGASLPGSTGAANPALTVAANAERIMETVAPSIA